jgi:hypothetical protein
MLMVIAGLQNLPHEHQITVGVGLRGKTNGGKKGDVRR